MTGPGVLSCGQVRELAPDLALGVLTGAERAEALVHVNGCAPCRTLVVDLSETADTLPLLVAEAEPPPGFEAELLSMMDDRHRRRLSLLRRASAVAVVAAAACIVTLVLVRIVDGSRDAEAPGADTPAVLSPANEARTAPMTGAGDERVGTVFVTGGEPTWAYVFVDYGPLSSGSYDVEIRAGGLPTRAGEMIVADGRGSWAGAIDAPAGDSTIALVAADGARVCEGVLSAPETAPGVSS